MEGFQMIHCTFAGHREILHSGVEKRLADTLHSLLSLDNSFCFYNGGMGAFDLLCAETVRKAKSAHPEKRIKSLLVLPYMTQGINTNRIYLQNLYDGIIIPSTLENCHHKAAISLRNRWMIDHSQYLIAYIHREFGGAAKTFKYAQIRKLTIFNTAFPHE